MWVRRCCFVWVCVGLVAVRRLCGRRLASGVVCIRIPTVFNFWRFVAALNGLLAVIVAGCVDEAPFVRRLPQQNRLSTTTLAPNSKQLSFAACCSVKGMGGRWGVGCMGYGWFLSHPLFYCQYILLFLLFLLWLSCYCCCLNTNLPKSTNERQVLWRISPQVLFIPQVTSSQCLLFAYSARGSVTLINSETHTEQTLN